MKYVRLTKRQSRALYAITLALLLLCASALLLTHLGRDEIVIWDEARHVASAVEMLRSGDGIVTTYLGRIDLWNLKPPLSEWCMQLGFALLGIDATGARIYSPACMLVTLLAVALWLKRHVGAAASLAATALLVSMQTLYQGHFARYADADALFVMLYTLSMLCMLSAERDVRWLYGSALGFALAFLAKSWHAALIPATCFVYLTVARLWRSLGWKRLLTLVLTGLLPIALWAAARYLRDGTAFLARMITVDVLGRMAGDSGNNVQGPLFYLQTLAKEPLALTAFALCAAALLVRGKLPRSARSLGLLLWLALPLLAFSCSSVKYFWYIFPCYVPLSMLGGEAVQTLAERRSVPALAALICAGGMVCFGLWQSKAIVLSYACEPYVQLGLRNSLSWDACEGKELYILYDTGETSWEQDEAAEAMLSGGVSCKSGGYKAFSQAEDGALLLAGKEQATEEMLAGCSIVYEDRYLYLLRKGGA